MVMVVISHGVLPVAVLGFDEQHARGELALRLGAVLGADLHSAVAACAAVLIQRDGLRGLGNQPFVSVQVVGALGLGEWLAVFVTELLFPQPSVQRVVAVAGYQFSAAIRDLDEAVLGVVAVAPCLGGGLPLREVACGVVLVASNATLPATAAANLREAVVGVVAPCATYFAVGNAVAYRVQGVALGVATKQSTGVALHLGQAVVRIKTELLCFGGAEVVAGVGAAAVVQLLQFAKAVVEVERDLLARRFDVEVFQIE